MELKYKLLDHPFYQAWMEGKISNEQLSRYSKSYLEFIEKIPVYWQKILDHFHINDSEGNEIIAEEKDHVRLWKQWSGHLNGKESFPRMTKLFDAFDHMNASELLGALHAFEIQQPAVAKTKRAGLIQHYGFTPETTLYFDAHLNEQKHILFGESIAKSHAVTHDFHNGFQTGSKLVYESLDLFLN